MIRRVTLLAALAAGGLAPRPAHATTFTYTGVVGGMFGHNFNNASNWTPAGGPPDAGDTGTIEKDDVILLTASTGALNFLNLNGDNVMGAGATLYCGNSVLNVLGGGNGFTQVINDSALVVLPSAFFGFATDTLSLRLGGELRMQGGGAIATFIIRSSVTGYISGYGTVGCTASAGTGVDSAGTIHPAGGDLNVICANGAKLDLDGNSAGADLGGILDVTADGGLNLNGPLADPFSGVLSIGNNNRTNFSAAVPFNGTLNFVSGTTNVLAAPSVDFQSGADIFVQASDGEIEANTTFQNGSTLFLLNAADDLTLNGNSTISSGVSITGAGALRFGPGIASLLDNANVGVRVFNTGAGEIRVGASPGNATVAGYEQNSSSDLRIEIGGLTPGDQFDQLAVTGDATLGGELKVSLINAFQLGKAQSFEIMDIGGTRSGTFINLAEGAKVGNFSGKDLFITYNGGDGNDIALFTKGFAADFDSDLDVDGADFLIWQSHNGLAMATPSIGDADGNTVVNGDDLAIWQNQFGSAQAVAASAAVPEPATVFMPIAGAAALALCRRRGVS